MEASGNGGRRVGAADGEREHGTQVPEGISDSDLEEIRPGANDRLRRTVIFGATAVACAATLAYWLMATSRDVDPVERVVVPLLALFFFVLSLTAWRVKLRGAEIALLVLGSGVLLERIHFARHVAKPGLAPVLDAYEVLVWFPCLYVFAFLLLDRRRALLFCLALLGTSALVVRDWMIPGAAAIYYADLTEFYIGQLGGVLFVYGFARLKEQFLDTHRLAVHLRSYAETDFLTGVANRRAMTQALEHEIHRCLRQESKLGVILLDLDRFKHINDSFGHDEGDRALRRVAYLLDRSRRQSDLFGRWGGEEFLLVAPGLDLAGSELAAERLRGMLEESNRGSQAVVTASFGVAEYRAGDGVASLVQRADQALMAAKAQGRNRVVARAA